MKPSKKKTKKKKKPASAEAGTPAPPPHPAADSTADPCSPAETLTLAAASETESSSSSCEASSTSAFTASSSGTASTFSHFSSSASSASAGDERRDLAWLLDAFSSATIDQVDSAYREAAGDPFLAAGILGAAQHPPPPDPSPSPRDGSAGRKAARKPKKVVCAASGMVSDVIGKQYTRPAPSPPPPVTNAWKGKGGLSATNECKGGGATEGGDVARNYSVEEAEQFLCAMLGDNSDLGMGVVRDVLAFHVLP